MRGTRGRRMSLTMQGPQYSLNPVMRAGDSASAAWTCSSSATT